MKILLIHASAGAGHRKAAEAVYNGLQNAALHDITLVDALDYTSPFYKTLYRETYSFLITKIPWFWGLMFRLLDIPFLLPFVQKFRRLQNWANGPRLAQYLRENDFDYIISTHFFPTEMTAALKRKGEIKGKIITVVTDYDVHSIWLAKGVDHYCVATDWTKKKLIYLGIGENDVTVTGIPTDAKFSLQRDKAELKRRLDLQEGAFTVLIATGSFGIGPIEPIVEALEGFQIVVVCGHNKHLYKRLQAKNKPLVKVCGLVDNMDELMAVADVMVTKPGGLSISEALVSELPLIFFNAIPGQESNNVKVLKAHGVGISNCSIKDIAAQLRQFKSSKEEFLSAVEKINALARPSAVNDIISLLS